MFPGVQPFWLSIGSSSLAWSLGARLTATNIRKKKVYGLCYKSAKDLIL